MAKIRNVKFHNSLNNFRTDHVRRMRVVLGVILMCTFRGEVV